MLFSRTVRVYGTYTREISLLRRSGAAFRQTEKTMYSLQAHLEHPKEKARQETDETH